MLYRLAADVTLSVHLAFIVFVVFGGLLTLYFRHTPFIHIPAAAWGAFAELSGRVCPLTTLENVFRREAGQLGYSESFVEHYILPIVYPAGLSREIQLWLGVAVIVFNALIYAFILYRKISRSQPR